MLRATRAEPERAECDAAELLDFDDDGWLAGPAPTLAEAVAICRAGRWDQGLAEFARLVAEYPRYPDIRARHAAALYQIGRSREALAEAEAALEGNPRYRTAVALKGLILAGTQDEIHQRIGKELPENVCEWTNSGEISVSRIEPSLVLRRYFLSQISCEASCRTISIT